MVYKVDDAYADKSGRSNSDTLLIGVWVCTIFLGGHFGMVNIKYTHAYFKTAVTGTTLVTQWISLHTPSAWDWGSIPGQGTRSCKSGRGQQQQKKYLVSLDNIPAFYSPPPSPLLAATNLFCASTSSLFLF